MTGLAFRKGGGAGLAEEALDGVYDVDDVVPGQLGIHWQRQGFAGCLFGYGEPALQVSIFIGWL